MRTNSQKANFVLGAAIITALGISSWDEAAAQTASNVICNGCIGSRDIKNGNVKGIDVLNESLTGADVKNGSLSGADIKDGTVGPADLAPAAKPSGAAKNETVPSGLNASTNGLASGKVMTSVSINLPAPGQVVVTATGSLGANAGVDIICYIGKTENTSIIAPYFGPERFAQLTNSTASAINTPMALVDIFQEATAGPQTYNLYCEGPFNTAGVWGSSIVAVYVPSALEVLP